MFAATSVNHTETPLSKKKVVELWSVLALEWRVVVEEKNQGLGRAGCITMTSGERMGSQTFSR